MLNDVMRLAKSGGSLDERGADGATLVSILETFWNWSEFFLDINNELIF